MSVGDASIDNKWIEGHPAPGKDCMIMHLESTAPYEWKSTIYESVECNRSFPMVCVVDLSLQTLIDSELGKNPS